jgi:hypothetical protein
VAPHHADDKRLSAYWYFRSGPSFFLHSASPETFFNAALLKRSLRRRISQS